IGAPVAAILAAGVLKGSLALVFWLAVLARLADKVMRNSIHQSSFMILYQPLPAQERLAAQARVESMIEPLTGAFSGGLLLLLTSVLSFHTVHLAGVATLVVVGWIAAALLLRREYGVSLMRALQKRSIGATALS